MERWESPKLTEVSARARTLCLSFCSSCRCCRCCFCFRSLPLAQAVRTGGCAAGRLAGWRAAVGTGWAGCACWPAWVAWAAVALLVRQAQHARDVSYTVVSGSAGSFGAASGDRKANETCARKAFGRHRKIGSPVRFGAARIGPS